MSLETKPADRKRFPSWLRRHLVPAGRSCEVRGILSSLGLETVCSGANCPNISECFGRGTATFMILGAACTRSCRFCAVGSADGCVLPPREDEPAAVAEAAEKLNLKHVVITSVTRDDLPDGGAEHFARTIRAVRQRLPEASVEVLTPDFQGLTSAIDTVVSAGPDVFNHNIETVPRLYRQVRPQADYKQSLAVLEYAKRRASQVGLEMLTKSGMMVGLGETPDEIRGAMSDLREAGCDILTIGQYLAPSPQHTLIDRFVEPGEFDAMRAEALKMGFRFVAAGPFVRSSYRAEEALERTGKIGRRS